MKFSGKGNQILLNHETMRNVMADALNRAFTVRRIVVTDVWYNEETDLFETTFRETKEPA